MIVVYYDLTDRSCSYYFFYKRNLYFVRVLIIKRTRGVGYIYCIDSSLAKYKQSLSIISRSAKTLEKGSFKVDFKRIVCMLDSNEKCDIEKANNFLTGTLNKRIDNNIALPYYFRKLTEEKYEKYKIR